MNEFKVGDIVRRSYLGRERDSTVEKSWDLLARGNVTAVYDPLVTVMWYDLLPGTASFTYNKNELEIVDIPTTEVKINLEVPDTKTLGETIHKAMSSDIFSGKTTSTIDGQIDAAYSAPDNNMDFYHFLDDIAGEVWRQRRAANMKRKRLAKLVGLTRKDIKNIENGGPDFEAVDIPLSIVFKIFQALGRYPKFFSWEGWNQP